jgi:hypothetical protein
LFTNEGGLDLGADAVVGKLRLDGQVTTVEASPAHPARLDDATRARRLFFSVKTPAGDGEYRLRCSIYFKATLLQSRDVRVVVAADGAPRDAALQMTLDYTITRSFSKEHVAAAGADGLSLFLNDSGDATHSLRIFGTDGDVLSARFDTHALEDLIRRSRAALQQVSWGDPGPFHDGLTYRYATRPSHAALRDDLFALAVAGRTALDAVIDGLGGAGHAWDALLERLRAPRTLQLSPKVSPRHIVPLATLYDRPLAKSAEPGDITLCEAFVAALDGGHDLRGIDCMQGRCPSQTVRTVVCPGGFWGFRHAIGVPTSQQHAAGDEAAEDAATRLACGGVPEILAAVCRDPRFTGLPDHEAFLHKTFARVSVKETLADTLAALHVARAHLIYFFCHGGARGGDPYLKIGFQGKDELLDRSRLSDEKIHFDEPRSFVFINGCRTTNLEPERAVELVSGFVGYAGASAVMGTEISVFDQLATEFAQKFLEAFLVDREELGAAVRSARLALLAESNPLGLVYLPFGLARLRLDPRAPSPPQQ